MQKIILSTAFGLLLAILMPAAAYAHVVVTPSQAKVGMRTTLSVSVPNERDSAVTSLKMTIPAGVDEVQPTVHRGWTISTTKDSTGNITAITWNGGTIPSGQRDDFTFRAQMPAKAEAVQWHAYQTYADGTVVAWDQKPSESETDSGNSTTGPYSVTKVVDDLSSDAAAAPAQGDTSARTLPLALSLVALVLSVIALTRTSRPRSKE